MKALDEQTALHLERLNTRHQQTCLSCRHAQVQGFWPQSQNYVPRVVCARDHWPRSLPLTTVLRGATDELKQGKSCQHWTD